MGGKYAFLDDDAHRPWEKPTEKWQYYQEWTDILFLHFEVEHAELRSLIPDDLKLDDFNGKYYVSVLGFNMHKLKPSKRLAIKFRADYNEIQIRTYVSKNNKRGLYVLNMEVADKISSFVAQILSGMPYNRSLVERTENSYLNINKHKGYYLDVDYDVLDKIDKSPLVKWLTEIYRFYIFKANDLKLFEIHHKEWSLHEINLRHLKINYQFKNLKIDAYKLISCQFSPGIQVASWDAEDVI